MKISIIEDTEYFEMETYWRLLQSLINQDFPKVFLRIQITDYLINSRNELKEMKQLIENFNSNKILNFYQQHLEDLNLNKDIDAKYMLKELAVAEIYQLRMHRNR